MLFNCIQLSVCNLMVIHSLSQIILLWRSVKLNILFPIFFEVYLLHMNCNLKTKTKILPSTLLFAAFCLTANVAAASSLASNGEQILSYRMQQLTEFPENICCHQYVETMDFAHNDISSISFDFSRTPRLKSLDLEGNKNLKRLPASILRCKKLTHLNLKQCPALLDTDAYDWDGSLVEVGYFTLKKKLLDATILDLEPNSRVLRLAPNNYNEYWHFHRVLSVAERYRACNFYSLNAGCLSSSDFFHPRGIDWESLTDLNQLQTLLVALEVHLKVEAKLTLEKYVLTLLDKAIDFSKPHSRISIPDIPKDSLPALRYGLYCFLKYLSIQANVPPDEEKQKIIFDFFTTVKTKGAIDQMMFYMLNALDFFDLYHSNLPLSTSYMFARLKHELVGNLLSQISEQKMQPAFIHYFSKLFGLDYKEMFHFHPPFPRKELLYKCYTDLCQQFNPLNLARCLQKNMQDYKDSLDYAKMSDFDKKQAIREQFVKTIPFEMLRNFILQYQSHCPDPRFDWSLLFFPETAKYINNVKTGRLNDLLYAQLSEDGALDVLRMLGYVSAPDLCGYMRRADASSNPSLVETFGEEGAKQFLDDLKKNQ
jgi:hypothetical protein